MTKKIFFSLLILCSLSCAGSISYDKVCSFVEHSEQIFTTDNGFFSFSVRDYKRAKETLYIRFFDRSGKQLSSNEMDYPFLFYNFLIRQKEKDSVFLASKSNKNRRQNLIIEITADCKKVGEYYIDAENFETISDILIMNNEIFLGGWVENNNIGSQNNEPNKIVSNKVVVEHNMWLAVYDTKFTKKSALIRGKDDSEYIFSLTPASDNSRIYYTGSIMNFEVDQNGAKILKSTSLFIKEADIKVGNYDLRGADYQLTKNFIPFFIKEYDEKKLLLILMFKENNKDFLGVALADKNTLNINLSLYPVFDNYLIFYPVIADKNYLIFRMFGLRTNLMDRFLIIDNNIKKGVEVKIDGVNRMALRLEGEELNILYSVASAPCNESVFGFTKLPIKEILSSSKIQIPFTKGVFYREFKMVDEINLKERKKD